MHLLSGRILTNRQLKYFLPHCSGKNKIRPNMFLIRILFFLSSVKVNSLGFCHAVFRIQAKHFFFFLSASLPPPVKVPEIQSKQVWGSFHIKLSAYFKLSVGGKVRDNNRQSDISVRALRTCHESSGAEEGSQTMTGSKRSVGCFNDRGFTWFLWRGGWAVMKTLRCRCHFWGAGCNGRQRQQTQGGSAGATGFGVLVLVAG